jgi:hypothetical protein
MASCTCCSLQINSNGYIPCPSLRLGPSELRPTASIDVQPSIHCPGRFRRVRPAGQCPQVTVAEMRRGACPGLGGTSSMWHTGTWSHCSPFRKRADATTGRPLSLVRDFGSRSAVRPPWLPCQHGHWTPGALPHIRSSSRSADQHGSMCIPRKGRQDTRSFLVKAVVLSSASIARALEGSSPDGRAISCRHTIPGTS